MVVADQLIARQIWGVRKRRRNIPSRRVVERRLTASGGCGRLFLP